MDTLNDVRARRASLLNYFSLFSSCSTLLCCALPTVLVLLGLGTTVASILSVAPWLVSLSRHKTWTFAISGTLIALSFIVTFFVVPRIRPAQCDVTEDPSACLRASELSRTMLLFSGLVWCVGFFVAYLLAPILNHFVDP